MWSAIINEQVHLISSIFMKVMILYLKYFTWSTFTNDLSCTLVNVVWYFYKFETNIVCIMYVTSKVFRVLGYDSKTSHGYYRKSNDILHKLI